ncbi:MAG: hypothetical protein QNJ41_19045 [Xenococcaceae cyanobacterium MO_188.B32]|nr:hypothetical protein [Xenococcaceae cyanobacterium MO_188.B32]
MALREYNPKKAYILEQKLRLSVVLFANNSTLTFAVFVTLFIGNDE